MTTVLAAAERGAASVLRRSGPDPSDIAQEIALAVLQMGHDGRIDLTRGDGGGLAYRMARDAAALLLRAQRRRREVPYDGNLDVRPAPSEAAEDDADDGRCGGDAARRRDLVRAAFAHLFPHLPPRGRRAIKVYLGVLRPESPGDEAARRRHRKALSRAVRRLRIWAAQLVPVLAAYERPSEAVVRRRGRSGRERFVVVAGSGDRFAGSP